MDGYSNEPDFEAEIRTLTADQGGRTTPPHNYIRWGFGYAEDNPLEPKDNLSATLHMIFPKFLNLDGASTPKGVELYGTLTAHMYILDRAKVEYHRSRLIIGTNFNCHEGNQIVARGTVRKLLGALA